MWIEGCEQFFFDLVNKVMLLMVVGIEMKDGVQQV